VRGAYQNVMVNGDPGSVIVLLERAFRGDTEEAVVRTPWRHRSGFMSCTPSRVVKD
jgi:hypothetical protein